MLYLMAVLTLTTALPLLTFGLHEASNSAERAEHQSEVDDHLRADAFAREVAAIIETRVRSVVALAAVVAVADARPTGDLQRVVDAVRERAGHFDFMYVADSDAVSLAASPSVDADGRATAGMAYADRDYIQSARARRAVAISSVQLGRRSRRPNVQIAVPIWDAQGRLGGFAEGSVDLDPIGVAALRAGQDARRILLLDGDARVVADSSGHATVLETLASAPLAALLTAEHRAVETRDEAGDPVRGAVVPVRLYGHTWYALSLRPAAAVEAVAAAAARRVLLQTAGMLLVAFVLSLLASWYLGRAVRRWVAIMRRLGRGEFDVQVRGPGRLEIREVTEIKRALTATVGQLREYSDQVTESLAALSAANERLRPLGAAWNHVHEAVEITDRDGRIVFANPAHEQLTGMSATRSAGSFSTALRAALETELPDQASIVADLSRGEAWRGELTLEGANGPRNLDVLISPIRDDAGRLVQMVLVFRDVTATRKAQAALRTSERMASLGTLAAGVAHEINNPMAYILTNIELSLDGLRAEHAARPNPIVAESIEMLEDAQTGSHRVSEIARGLLRLGTADTGDEALFDPLAVTESCLRLSAGDLGRRVTVVSDLRPLNRVWGRERCLSQVLINLLVNASQSFSPEQAVRELRVRTHTGSDGAAIIEISDNGIGIPEALQGRIFDPFFTTKAVGEGTGLGLSICHQIISEMGGMLTVASAPNCGTTMTICLPRAQAAWSSHPVLTPNYTLGSRVLVVDDNPLIGRMTGRSLARHQVLVVADVLAASEALESGVFDLILCSTTLPEPGPLALFDVIVAHWPGQADRVVFTHQGVVSGVVEERLTAMNARRLEKPLDPLQLRRTLKEVVAEAGRTSNAA